MFLKVLANRVHSTRAPLLDNTFGRTNGNCAAAAAARTRGRRLPATSTRRTIPTQIRFASTKVATDSAPAPLLERVFCVHSHSFARRLVNGSPSSKTREPYSLPIASWNRRIKRPCLLRKPRCPLSLPESARPRHAARTIIVYDFKNSKFFRNTISRVVVHRGLKTLVKIVLFPPS